MKDPNNMRSKDRSKDTPVVGDIRQQLHRCLRALSDAIAPLEADTEQDRLITEQQLIALIYQTVSSVIDKTHDIYLTKNDDGTVDMQDDVVAHWDALRAKQHEFAKRLLGSGEV